MPAPRSFSWHAPKALLEFTAGCNADCIFCLRNISRKAAPPPKEIDFDRLGDFLELAGQFGLKRIELAGDEPTVLPRKVLVRVARSCREAGFDHIQIMTNGIALGDEDWTNDLLDSGIRFYILPIYGASSAVHDSITQTPGSFESVCRAIKLLRNRGAVVLLHTTVLRRNEDKIGEIAAMARRWGAPFKIRRLNRIDSHVDYASLAPSRERPNASRFLRAVELRYKILSGELDLDREVLDLRRFLDKALRAAGVPARRTKALLSDMRNKTLLKNPKSILRLLSGAQREEEPFEFLILEASSAVSLMELARDQLRAGKPDNAAAAFREILRREIDSEPSRRIHASARQFLQKLNAKEPRSSRRPRLDA